MKEEGKKEEKRKEDILNAGIVGASHDTVQRYGEAVGEHFDAYLGKTKVKGLKSISKDKINRDFEFNNIQQQAGFSAEVKDVARTNAEYIINGKQTRKVRTDDLGRVNDPLYDTILLDENGDEIAGTGAQMKFLGASQKDPTGEGDALRALNKLQSKKFQKYLDADAKIDVPSNQYDDIISEANRKIESLSKQIENQKESGNNEQVQKIQNQIERLEKIKKNLRSSTVSSDEAVFARLHPELSTAVDVAKISHKAGIQTAKTSAIFGGSVSIVRNLVSVCKGEKEPEEAIKSVAKDTATDIAMGYGTGFAGSTIKGAMQNASSGYIQSLSKTSIPSTIVAVTVSATKTLSKFFKGEIDGVECLEELGEEGTGMISSAMFATIGQVVIPIPIVGGLIGGMVGYALSSATYRILTDSLREAKLAREEREQIERICEEHIKMIREYRQEIEKIISEYLVDSMDVFHESFYGIKNALNIGDVDWFIDSTNSITNAFGGQPSFSNMEEFNSKMLSGETFKL